MKSPKAIIVIIIFCFLLIVGIFLAKKHQAGINKANTSVEPQKLFDVASGDTNNEVLNTIAAKQGKIQKEAEKVLKENERLKKEGTQKTEELIKKAMQNIQQEISNNKSMLEQQIEEQKNDTNNLKKNNLEINGNSEGAKTNIISDVPDLSKTFPSSADKLEKENQNEAPELPSEAKEDNEKKDTKKAIPYYTIPANSTLNNAVLMSSIIAEVPVSSHLESPAFPFKAIVGKKELFAANGIAIPDEISGMVLEGYSVGNMTMSCARVYVTRALFVFNDGHFVVYPEKDQNDATEIYPKNALGYLSDSFGNTCISGKYITNAPKVLGNIIAITTAGGVGDAFAQAQTSTMQNAFQSNTIVTGDIAKYAAGAAIGNASKEVLNWYLSRVSGVFDAVYIPASLNKKPVRLVFNVSKTIPIDLNKEGRTLRYENTNQENAKNNFD